MKILLQAFLGAVLIHALYFGTDWAVSYAKALTYRPNIAMYWNPADRLPQEAAFGAAVSPAFYLATFLDAMLMWGLLLFFFQKKSAPLP